MSDSLETKLDGATEVESEQQKRIKILITGKSGNSKSVIINGLAGKYMIEERRILECKPRSDKLQHYVWEERGIKLDVWSSPHLQDQDDRISIPEYLQELKEACSDVHLIIYCINMNLTRFLPGNPDARAMDNLTKLFGEQCWEKTIFALTFANVAAVDRFAPEDDESDTEENRRVAFQKGIEVWQKILTKVLIQEAKVTEPVVRVVPTGHYKKPALPDRASWLTDLFIECGSIMPDEIKDNFIEFNQSRFKDEELFSIEDIKGKKSHQQPIFVAWKNLKSKVKKFKKKKAITS